MLKLKSCVLFYMKYSLYFIMQENKINFDIFFGIVEIYIFVPYFFSHIENKILKFKKIFFFESIYIGYIKL
jgi:hypothetical protein